MGIFDIARQKMGMSETEGKIASVDDQTDEEKRLAGYLKSKVSEMRASSSRIAHEGIWMTNIAYLLGYDSVYYDTDSRQFKPIGRATQYLSRNRIHVNKILPIIQNRLSRLCKNPPRYDVRPNSNDQQDKDAAQLGVKVITNTWDREAVNNKRIDLYMWVQQCGHAWIKTGWDAEKGKMARNPETNEIEYQGDISVTTYSPFEVFPDPLATSDEDMRFLMTVKVRKLDYFKENYPERGGIVESEDAWLLSTQYLLRINSMNTQGPTSSAIQQQMDNSALELAYYEKPSRKHPGGRLVVTANGIVLKDEALPVDEIPFSKFDDIKIGGKMYSESIITHLRPMQDQYNRVITRRSVWTNALLAGKYMAARGHGLSQEALNDTTEVVEYDHVPGSPPPAAMNIPNIPQYAYAEEEALEQMLNDVAGINEVSKGQLPAAGLPAIGMQLLTEQDDTRIGIMVESHEHSWSKVGRLILKFAENFYEGERILKEVGKNDMYMVKKFTGKDIIGNNDVIVIRGSTLPGSKVLRRQEVINLYNQGLMGNPQEPQVREKVLSMLEFGDVSEAWKDHDADIKQIDRDIEQMKQGEQVQIHELDNHHLHVMEKNRFRKTEDFIQLEQNVQMLILENIEKHVQAATQIMSDMQGSPSLGQIENTAELDQERSLDAADMIQSVEDLSQSIPQDGTGDVIEEEALSQEGGL